MTNELFQILIDRTHLLKEDYFDLLKKTEEEYEKRYGNNPSDIDDDSWIDSMHQPGCDPPTVATDGIVY